MRKMLLLVALLALPGCAWMSTKSAITDIPVEKSLPELGQKAQMAVNAGEGTLAVIYTVLRDGLRAQTLSVKDYDALFARAEQLRDGLNQAQSFINAGSFDAAQAKAAATQTLIKLLHDEAVKAAKARTSSFDSQPLLLGA